MLGPSSSDPKRYRHVYTFFSEGTCARHERAGEKEVALEWQMQGHHRRCHDFCVGDAVWEGKHLRCFEEGDQAPSVHTFPDSSMHLVSADSDVTLRMAGSSLMGDEQMLAL